MPKPRRLPNTRRALTADELAQINEAARASGDDVVLDALLLRLHTETACRRGGALGLRLADLDVRNGQAHLTEKGGTQRWQPITTGLARHLLALARARGAVLLVAAMPRGTDNETAFIPGDEIMVVFTADQMRKIGFPDTDFLNPCR